MSRSSVVVVGGGFAGYFAARTLERLLPEDSADLTLVSATDHLCYSPLLPEVASGRLDPRRIAVPLHSRLRRTRVVQATVEDVDFERRTLEVVADSGPVEPVRWNRLALTTGSITRTLPTPGVSSCALGLKTLVEAQFVHDHVLRQLELADSTANPDERRARLTFIVVGAGYAGTETAAQLQRTTVTQLDRFPRVSRDELRWVLLDLAPSVLPEREDDATESSGHVSSVMPSAGAASVIPPYTKTPASMVPSSESPEIHVGVLSMPHLRSETPRSEPEASLPTPAPILIHSGPPPAEIPSPSPTAPSAAVEVVELAHHDEGSGVRHVLLHNAHGLLREACSPVSLNRCS